MDCGLWIIYTYLGTMYLNAKWPQALETRYEVQNPGTVGMQLRQVEECRELTATHSAKGEMLRAEYRQT